MKGYCKDCLFLKQDWLVFEKKNGQLSKELDWVCFICDIFKSPDGYCDLWEPK